MEAPASVVSGRLTTAIFPNLTMRAVPIEYRVIFLVLAYVCVYLVQSAAQHTYHSHHIRSINNRTVSFAHTFVVQAHRHNESRADRRKQLGYKYYDDKVIRCAERRSMIPVLESVQS